MKRPNLTTTVLAASVATAMLWVSDVVDAQQAAQTSPPTTVDEVNRTPELPKTPSARAAAQPVLMQWVQLTQPYPTDFRAERPLVRAGWLVVIRADSALLTPRSLAEPLLLASADGWTASVEWMQHGATSGHSVCFVPWVDQPQPPVGSDGRAPTDESKQRASLRGLRMWFGTPELPERVDAALLARERALADASGLQPLPKDRIPTASADITLADRSALVARMRELATIWCPAEVEPEVPAGPSEVAR